LKAKVNLLVFLKRGAWRIYTGRIIKHEPFRSFKIIQTSNGIKKFISKLPKPLD
jgi:hypothetical protein